MAFLRVVSGPQKGREYELTARESVIGRNPACQIVVSLDAVSRQHARVLRTESGDWIEDLQSRNGTKVNDETISRRRKLLPGDVIKICDVAFTYVDPNVVVSKGADGGSSIIRPRSDRGAGNTVVIDEGNNNENTSIMSQLDLSPGGSSLQATAEVRLRALMEISQALAKSLSLEDVFPKVLDSLFRIFAQADRGFIVTKSPTGELVPRWSKTRKGSSETMRISREIVNLVMRSKQAILSVDAASDQRLGISDSVARLQIRSFLCAPLLDADGEPLGVLQLDSLDPTRQFVKEDLEVLATVALQAGIAIGIVRMQEAALRQRELDRDLELAHEVQHGFLPLDRPRMLRYDFADYYLPANHVGGDFYDYVALPDGRLAVIVADVVGHGIAAALLMAKISAEARFSLATEPDLAAAARRVNSSLAQLHLDRFVTMVIGLIEPATRKITIVNAGHMAPIRRLASGRVEQSGQEHSGLPLGILDDFPYESYSMQLEDGDELVFMTDGIFEASNDRDEQLGLDRVRVVIGTEGGRSAEETCEALVSRVKEHLGQKPPDDDMCLVVLRCVHEAGSSVGNGPTVSQPDDSAF